MALEVAVAAGPAGSPDSTSSSNDIDRLLSEILNDPSVFSLIDSPSSFSSSAPSPCYSPSPQQLEQEAIASLGQHHQTVGLISADESSHYSTPETPSPTTPSSSIEDHQAFFTYSSALPSPPALSRPHPQSLPLHNQSPSSYPHQVTSTMTAQQLQSPTSSPLLDIEITISDSVSDPFLRGRHGKITGLHRGIVRVLLFCVNQEYQIPGVSVDVMIPVPGNPVRVIDGPLAGVSGWLVRCLGRVSHVQLCSGRVAEVETKNVAKLATDGVALTSTPNPLPSPLPSPTSPSIMSPTCESPLLSPASLPSGRYPSILSPYSPYLPNLAPSSNTNHSNGPLSRQVPYLRHTRLPASYHHTMCNETVRISRRSQMLELQRRHMYQQRLLRKQNHHTVGRGGDAQTMQRQIQHILQQRARIVAGGIVKSGLCPEQEYLSLSKCMDCSTQDIVDEIRSRKTLEYDFGSTGDGGELSSSCVQVPLICPLSQRRMTLPCRGLQCKHPQCFDVEAYVEHNKCLLRPKERGTCRGVKKQLFKCPVCSTHLPFSQLYVDKTLLQILQDTDQDEVEFDKTGSWKPLEKKSLDDDVIDLTLEDEDS